MAVKKQKASSRQARKEAEYAAFLAARGDPPPAAVPAEPEDDTVYIAEPFPEPTASGARPSGKGEDFAVLAKPEPTPELVALKPNAFDGIGVCFICAATSCGLGVIGLRKRPKFYCTTCGPILAKAVAMKDGILNDVEIDAIDQAGAEIGEYLESVGKTDLATLTEGEYRSFCRRFLASYITKARVLARYNLPD